MTGGDLRAWLQETAAAGTTERARPTANALARSMAFSISGAVGLPPRFLLLPIFANVKSLMAKGPFHRAAAVTVMGKSTEALGSYPSAG
jgi:hypothetical protein